MPASNSSLTFRRSPDGRILAYAAENDLDLVAMGMHGHSGIERHLLGSVTQHVAGAAAVPVVTVSAPAENVV
jgi:nucleotide-binding universal stress UspA family protein